ncbi:unnamed protein product [Hymenolepis diminuta]|uniref:Uncharacterized protein n=1 Tax=Hymenolepis diminuta TaxID=6216 RepID=A0A564XZX4_HYMDI|nr:unnamed protein product [Hymenolepis diminuta]
MPCRTFCIDQYRICPVVCKTQVKHCLPIPEPWKCHVVCEKSCMPKCCPRKMCCDKC